LFNGYKSKTIISLETWDLDHPGLTLSMNAEGLVVVLPLDSRFQEMTLVETRLGRNKSQDFYGMRDGFFHPLHL
jgi:hypothetical protein